MTSSHRLFLSLGSNIQPELNLPRAIELLKKRCRVGRISSAWESLAVGSSGPNFLNACLELVTPLSITGFSGQVIRPIESTLGRLRTANKNASRPIDIDIILFDDIPLRLEYWTEAFLVVPLAELLPDYTHPTLEISLAEASTRLKESSWILPRFEILMADPLS